MHRDGWAGSSESCREDKAMSITMTGRGFEGMREEELCALERTRMQLGKVARLRARCDEITPNGGYKSPTVTGMPSARGVPCGLDGSARECEALLEELEREEARLASMIRQGERIIARSAMKEEMREFCSGYFLRRMSVESAAEHTGVSSRTGWNYKGEIYAFRRRKNKASQEKNTGGRS